MLLCVHVPPVAANMHRHTHYLSHCTSKGRLQKNRKRVTSSLKVGRLETKKKCFISESILGILSHYFPVVGRYKVFKQMSLFFMPLFNVGSVAGIHSAGIDISRKFLKTYFYTVYTYLDKRISKFSHYVVGHSLVC